MLNYNTENNNITFNKSSLGKSINKTNSVMLNFTFGGDKLKFLDKETSGCDGSKTSRLLRKLKNLTLVKYNLIEALKLMPPILKKSVNSTIRERNKDLNQDEMRHYHTNANLEELDLDNFKFSPNKRKKTKKDKITSKLNEIYSFDTSSIIEGKNRNIKQDKLKPNPFMDEEQNTKREFYKSYCEEMEKQYEQIFHIKENLYLKIEAYKKFEVEYENLQKDLFNFNLFKKICRKKSKVIDGLEISDKNKNKLNHFTNFACENPKCISQNFNYVELKREFEILMLQNNKFKKYYFDLKFKKNVIKFHDYQLEELY